MKTVVYTDKQRVIDWVAKRVEEDGFGSGAIGIGLEEDGELIAGVVFNDYTGPGISMHVAAVPGKRWMTREYLWACFAYPFLQLKCNRVTGLVRTDNIVAQKFDEHLGFKREGVLRRACSDGTDMIVYGMLRDECRFLEIKR
ncbi:MAG: GNAT family N-acetyltransferase [Polynucleobacter sp.]